MNFGLLSKPDTVEDPRLSALWWLGMLLVALSGVGAFMGVIEIVAITATVSVLLCAVSYYGSRISNITSFNRLQIFD